jgi:hypothetical protein
MISRKMIQVGQSQGAGDAKLVREPCVSHEYVIELVIASRQGLESLEMIYS